MSRSVEPQAVATLQLDIIDSSGSDVFPVNVFPASLMALAPYPEHLWFGFVLTDEETPAIEPGDSRRVHVAFFDGDGARARFHPGMSILFGDGARTRGVVVIEKYLK